MWWLWAAVASAAALLSFAVYGLHLGVRRRLRHIPGPTPHWLLGNLPEILSLGQHEAYRRWAREHGPVFRVLNGAEPLVVVADAELARQYAARAPHRHPIPYLETGEEERFNHLFILFARGAWFRSLRGAWQPFFHSGSLARFAPLMSRAAERLVPELEAAAAEGRPLDLWHHFANLTLGVVGTTAFGVDFHTSKAAEAAQQQRYASEAVALVEASKVFFATQGPAILNNPYALLLFAFPRLAPATRHLANLLPTASYRLTRDSRRIMKDVGQRLLNETRQRAAGGGDGSTAQPVALHAAAGSAAAAASAGAAPVTEPQPAPAGKGVAPGSFMHLLMHATNKETGKPFSDAEVINQAFAFLLAGGETTASSMISAVYLLACNPDKEARLLAELDAFGRERAPTPADLEAGKFPYADAVFKETLRLFPSVPLMAREAQDDLTLGGIRIPAGTFIQTSIYGMHRNPHYWQEPEAFVPERFLAGTPEAARTNLVAYMPWGEPQGPRACVGVRFATQEFMLALLHLYQRFTFRLAPGQPSQLPIKFGLTLAPAGPVLLTVHPR